MTPGACRTRRPIPPGPAPWAALGKTWALSAEAARLCWLREADGPGELAWRLDPSWDRATDPFLLEGVAAAVARIRQAIKDREPILVYGDYDVDGTTAVVLLKTAIEMLGGVARFRLGSVPFFLPESWARHVADALNAYQPLRSIDG